MGGSVLQKSGGTHSGGKSGCDIARRASQWQWFGGKQWQQHFSHHEPQSQITTLQQVCVFMALQIILSLAPTL